MINRRPRGMDIGWPLLVSGLIALMLWQLGKLSHTALIALVVLVVISIFIPVLGLGLGILLAVYLLIANAAGFSQKIAGMFGGTKKGGKPA